MGAAPNIFSTGDKVSFLNEKGGGVVVGFKNKTTVLVEIPDGFIIPYPSAQLVLVVKAEQAKQPAAPHRTENTDDVPGLEKLKGLKDFKPRKREISSRKKILQSREKVVDLHIEELVNSHKGWENAQIIQYQLTHFQQQLERAISDRLIKITFIHGVGNGRLKQEIIQRLKTYNGISFYDASYKKYGFGATEVLIHE